jgi:hypothetical protein
MGYVTLSLFIIMLLLGSRREPWALTLLMMMLLIEIPLQASIATFRATPALTNILSAATVALCAMKVISRQTSPFLGYCSREFWLTIAIFAWSAVSLMWTPAESLPPGRVISATGSYIITEALPYFVVFVLIAPLLATDCDIWARTCRVLIWVGPLIAGSLILNPEISIRGGRLGTELQGTLRSSPLALSQAGGMIAIAGALAITPAGNQVLKALRWMAFLGGAAVTLLSGTRGQAIFTVVCIAIAFPLSRPLKSFRSYAAFIASVAVMLTAGAVLFDIAMSQTDNDRWTADAISRGTNVRVQNISDLFNAFVENPLSWLIGLGFNAFTAYSRQLTEGYSHNMFVDVLCEEGVPMFFALCCVIYGAARASARLISRFADDPPRRSAISTLTAFALFAILISGKEGNLWSSWSVFMFCLIIVRIDLRESVADPVSETS